MLNTFYPSPKFNSIPFPRRLRAYVEIIGGELAIYPISDCDTEERDILDALRIFLSGGD